VSGARHLIVNADDLGLASGVNEGILQAHTQGIVTSASLMVRQAGADEAAALAAAHPRLAIGLHLDLGQWDYANGEWFAAYLRCDQQDERAVRAECRSQLEAFRALLGRDPTHLDSHQHVHESEPVSSVMTAIANELGVPLRGRRVRYEGGFYGQTGKGEPLPHGITAQALVSLIRALPAGWTELGCHPGIGDAAGSSYGRERALELKALCDPAVVAVLREEGIGLWSFADVPGGMQRST
jgi:chitin disaccharide deacetylase